MSTNIYKVEYECDCGVDYGGCEVKCAVILKSNGTCDIYTLYHTDSHKYLGNDKKHKTERGGLVCFSDNYLGALKKALSFPDKCQDLTDEEKKVVFE